MSEETEEKQPVEAAKTLTPVQWQEIRDLYELGKMRGSELARKYGVTPQAISQHFKRHSVGSFGSRAHEIAEAAKKKVIEQSAAELATFAAKRKKRIEETKEQSYQGAAVINAMALKIASEHAKGGSSAGTKLSDLKAFRHLTKIIQETLDIRWKVLDAEGDVDEQALPTLPIMVLTDEEVEELRGAVDGEDDLIDVPDLEDDIVVEGED